MRITAGNNPLMVPVPVDDEEQAEIDDIDLARKIAYFLELQADKIEAQQAEETESMPVSQADPLGATGDSGAPRLIRRVLGVARWAQQPSVGPYGRLSAYNIFC